MAVLIESIWKKEVLLPTTVPLSNCTAGSNASRGLNVQPHTVRLVVPHPWVFTTNGLAYRLIVCG